MFHFPQHFGVVELDVSQEVFLILLWGLPIIAAGVFAGVIAGALPGFGASNTLIILLPLTLLMSSQNALLLVVGLFVGVRLGGATPAILINVPGTASGAVTAMEGYPLRKQGKAGFALGIALMASVVGSFASGIIALGAAPAIAKVALSFSAPEIFALTIFSIAMVGQVAGDNIIKGWFAGAAGLLIGSVGVDPMWGAERGTFGFIELYDGIPVIAALVGLYAVSEVMTLAENRLSPAIPGDDTTSRSRIGEMLKGCRYVLRRPVDTIRSTFIGTFIGALPGAGANIASFISYQQAITFSPSVEDQKLFGKGNPRGIIASEAADNANASGAIVPMMTLGIPGSASTAVMLLMMSAHGLNVGPTLFIDTPVIAYAVLAAIPVAALLLIVIGFASVFMLARLILIPSAILIVIIAIFSLAGAFAARYLVFDIFLALFFGLVGYVMRKEGYPPQAMLIGIILAPAVESNFFIGLREGFGSPTIFFTRPIALAIWAMLIGSSLFIAWKKRQSLTRSGET